LAHIDADWYEPVKTCVERIEPHLSPGGVLVIDDYGHWSGCRKAVDEYFADKRDRYDLVHRARVHIVRR
jgi:asparagine synthase (glutamine-hydrolysing)